MVWRVGILALLLAMGVRIMRSARYD
jgi:hypothetical protein